MPRHLFRPRSEADEELERLGRLAGEARERARLHRSRVELAMALQRLMLPDVLPELPGLRVSACYAPAREGLDVGGDWYDAFPMPDGTAGVAIGDVQGHDVEAAAVVAQVRAGLRGIATVTTDPGEVLARVNDLLVEMGPGLFVTCTFLRYDPATGELADARAGHVPAIRAEGGGPPSVVLDPGGLPLGVFPHERYPVTRRRPAGPWAYVLVTDGVVEGPGVALDDGLARVAAVVGAGMAAARTPDELAEEVLAVSDLTGHSDDAAAVVLAHPGT
jgi:serine phosphatase RsbU (regulator of sigma subunit)